MANLKRIGALWKTKKAGFITGNLDISIGQSVKVGVGANTKKRDGSKDPDFYIYHLPEQQRETPFEESAQGSFDEEPDF